MVKKPITFIPYQNPLLRTGARPRSVGGACMTLVFSLALDSYLLYLLIFWWGLD